MTTAVISDGSTGRKEFLAPYAVHDGECGGRRFPEITHPFRSDFQRDRDRILHSRAFRRLEYKTQVFFNRAGSKYRNRLTHTIEVAAIARTMARALSLNEDLAETIALAHDLGHTPFGHVGERCMSRIMADHGGFDHNKQTVRIVDFLEIKYPAYDGLNLTLAVRSGLLKHRKEPDGTGTVLDGKILPAFPFAEAQIADVADDVTYYGHDVDDGLHSGLITLDQLETVELWRMCEERVRSTGLAEKNERFAAYTVRCLIDAMVGDVIRTSMKNIEELAPADFQAIENAGGMVISFSPDFEKLTGELKKFLYENLYFHMKLVRLHESFNEQLETCFHLCRQRPDVMGELFCKRIPADGLERAVCDFIASLTDFSAKTQYRLLTRRFPSGKHSDMDTEEGA